MPMPLIVIALAAGQVAAGGITAPTPRSSTAAPERISILLPACPPVEDRTDDEIVVCANPQGSSRLPLPRERPPVGPLQIAGAKALMVDPSPRPAGAAPCGARLEGCLVGFGPPIVPLLAKAATAVRSALTPKPDESGRVPIALDDPH